MNITNIVYFIYKYTRHNQKSDKIEKIVFPLKPWEGLLGTYTQGTYMRMN